MEDKKKKKQAPRSEILTTNDEIAHAIGQNNYQVKHETLLTGIILAKAITRAAKMIVDELKKHRKEI